MALVADSAGALPQGKRDEAVTMLPDPTALAAARGIGLRDLRALAQGQSLVLAGRLGACKAAVKLRPLHFARRLDKEADWLRRARELGCPAPALLADAIHSGWRILVCKRAGGSRRWRPEDWQRALGPLHTHSDARGWGFLRADGCARWPDRQAAQAQAAATLQRLDLGSEATVLLNDFWARASPRLLHGDPHPGNQCGPLLLDWEHVAIGDPALDWARLHLCGMLAQAPDHLEVHHWHGALLASALEAAFHPGPAARRSRLLLARMAAGGNITGR